MEITLSVLATLGALFGFVVLGLAGIVVASYFFVTVAVVVNWLVERLWRRKPEAELRHVDVTRCEHGHLAPEAVGPADPVTEAEFIRITEELRK